MSKTERTLSIVFILFICLMITMRVLAGAPASPLEAQHLEPNSPLGTGFTYQGFLKDSGGTPVSNTCDFRFGLWDALTDGLQIGVNDEVTGVLVSAGYFTALVNEGNEFTSAAFNGQARWLKVEVRCPTGVGDYTALDPRQLLSLSPYASYAGQAASVPWSGISSMPAGFADGTDDIGSGGDGDITGVIASTGLSGGGLSGDITLAITTTYRLPQGCTNGQVAKWTNGVWLCDTPDHGNLAGLGDDDHPQYFNLSQNETVTGLPSFANATRPFNVSSTGLVTNLNADLLDGFHNGSLTADLLDGLHAGNSSGYIPISNGTMNTNLNADMLDGLHSSSFATSSHNHWGESWSGSGTGLSLSSGTIGLSGSGSQYGIYGTSAGYGVKGLATGANGVGVYGENNAIASYTWGVYGRSASTYGYGVYGENTSTSGTNYGVSGVANSAFGYGLYGVAPVTATVGIATSTSGFTTGIYGQSSSPIGSGVYGLSSGINGHGVFGKSTATSGSNYGVWGESASTNGVGVYGINYATSGTNYGVYGSSASPNSSGVYGYNSATSGTPAGVFGRSYAPSGMGVYGENWATSGFGYGVIGYSVSTDGIGVYGWNSSTTGITKGVYGKSDSSAGFGVYGSAPVTGTVGIATSASGVGVYGKSPYVGVLSFATSTNSQAVHGESTSTSGYTLGVYGISASSDGTGVRGFASNPNGKNIGIAGYTYSSDGRGVYGAAPITGTVGIADNTSGATYGVWGQTPSTSGIGVYGLNTAASGVTYGVFGKNNSTTGDSAGVYGYNSGASGPNIGVYAKTDSTGGHAFYGLATASSGTNYGIYVNTNSASGYGGLFNNWGGGVAVIARSNTYTSTQDIFRVEDHTATPVFKVQGTGNVYADGTYYGAGGVSAGSADFAEMVPPGQTELEPGDVLVIDPNGEMIRCSKAYQTTVAGIYSTEPGFLAGNELDENGNPLDPERIPLAIVGIVPVKASAINGAIQPGDLLTTSAIAGYAMRAGVNPPIGTLIGKALQGLESGTGVIQVLVMLQ